MSSRPVRAGILAAAFVVGAARVAADAAIAEEAVRPSSPPLPAEARLIPSIEACERELLAGLAAGGGAGYDGGAEAGTACARAHAAARRAQELLAGAQGVALLGTPPAAATVAGAEAAPERLDALLADLVSALGAAAASCARCDPAHSRAKVEQARRAFVRELASRYAFGRAEMSVVLRGGLSLGNYQAGFMYYAAELLKARAGLFPAGAGAPRQGFATITGASAGGINSLVALLEGCRSAPTGPEETMFFKGWTRVGIVGRHRYPGFLRFDGDPLPEAESPLGIFSTEPLERAAEEVIDQIRGRGAPAGAPAYACDSTDLGITVTRLVPERYTLHSRVGEAGGGQAGIEAVLTAEKQAERVLLRFAFRRAAGRAAGDPILDIHPLVPGVPFQRGRRLGPGAGGDGEPWRDLDDDPRVARKSLALLPGGDYSEGEGLEEHGVRPALLGPLLQATSAFPIAFAPQRLTYTRVSRDGTRLDPPRTDRFVDGGLFDNTPLGLAIEIDRWRDDAAGEREHAAAGADAEAAAAWIDPRERACLVRRGSELEALLCDVLPPTPRHYLFVEPTATVWDAAKGAGADGAAEAGDEGLFPTFFGFAGAFLGTSMGASLVASAEANPFILHESSDPALPRLLVPRRSIELASRRMGNFMGFFEQDFRVYDFYVGVLEAERFFASDAVYSRAPAPRIESPKLACLRDYADRYLQDGGQPTERIRLKSEKRPSLPASCWKLESERDAALLGTDEKEWKRLRDEVIGRMGEDWDEIAGPDERARLLAAERRLGDENFRKLIVAMHNFRAALAGEGGTGVDEFELFFDELGEVGYVFVDLQRLRLVKQIGVNARTARFIVRDLLQDGINRLKRAQPTVKDRINVGLAGGILADFYEPWPSWFQISAGVNVNGVEGYLGFAPIPPRDWRLDTGARLYELRWVTYSDPQERHRSFFGAELAPFARLSYTIPSEWPVIRFAVGAGFIGSWLFAWNRAPANVMFRYGPEVTLSAVVLRHLYFDAQFDFFVDGCGSQFTRLPDRCLVNDGAYGQGSDPITRRDWRFSLGAGWRFLP